MGFLSLGKIDKNIIPIIIGAIFCFLDRFIDIYDIEFVSRNAIITVLIISFSKFLLYLI